MLKFVGKNNKGLLVEMSEYDLARILGFDSVYDKGFKELKSQFESEYNENFDYVGAGLNVDDIYYKAKYIRDRTDEAKKAIKTFRDLADAFEKTMPSFLKLANNETKIN